MIRRWGPYVFAAVVLACLFASPYAERADVLIRRDADAAYAYGLRHINQPSERTYDLSEARYFFERSLRIDPSYPLALHQLGRIAFLEGRYEEALAFENQEIARMGDDRLAAPYYTRALIHGYLKNYEASVSDYRVYASLHPEGWEGRTDLAWALIKTHSYDEALTVVDQGLAMHPGNPWLLSVRATALFELGRYREALDAVRAADPGIAALTEADWHAAYPGNSPEAARIGLETLRTAHERNRALIEAAAAR